MRSGSTALSAGDCGGGAPAFIERRLPVEGFLAAAASDCGGGAPAFIERWTPIPTRTTARCDCGGGAPAFIERHQRWSKCQSPTLAIAGAAPPPSLSDLEAARIGDHPPVVGLPGVDSGVTQPTTTRWRFLSLCARWTRR